MTALPGNFVLFAVHPGIMLGIVLALLLGGLVLWLLLGSGPRRSRTSRRAEQLLAQGQWEPALELVRNLRQDNNLSPAWAERLRALEGDCLETAGDFALKEQRFEDSLRLYRLAAPLLGADETASRDRVIEAMLATTRAQFAASNNAAVHTLVARVLAVQPTAAEAMFWQALCQLREGQSDQAVRSLENAHQAGNRQYIDPPLYLGILFHRQGRPQDSLRLLAEANRVDAGCPFVAWQMGQAMVAAGGDSAMAVRVLQRALGPKGLSMWLPMPARAWIEAFPQGRSFVRRLADKHPFPCPLLGSDLRVLIRQGELAIAQAQYRLGNYQEAADLYAKLMGEAPPTLPLVRGLGLSLARLGKYDQAYKHLRAAVDMDPQDALTVGHLALCGARGKPPQPEDKPKNVAWAIRQIARFDAAGNAEFASLMSAIHAEARALNMAVPRDDQVRLCNALASVRGHDPDAAAAYDRLAVEHPDAVVPLYAWLYCRAAVEHGFKGERDRDFFARTFRERPAAQAFFTQQGWDLEEVEYAYLERSAAACATAVPAVPRATAGTAAAHAGRFPEELGTDYASRGEGFLLERSLQKEQGGDLEAALRSVSVLLQLAPRCLAGYDRAAALHYRRQDGEQVLKVLTAWHELEPRNPLPLVRRAVVEQQQGNPAASQAAIGRALDLTRGSARAAVAFLGARLAVAASGSLAGFFPSQPASEPLAATANGEPRPGLEQARRLLLECLREQPDHTDALWTLAALRAVTGDTAALASQAPSMNRPEVKDARFHYLAAVCHLAARDYARAAEAAGRAAADPELAVEGQFVLAWAHLLQHDEASAAAPLEAVADVAGPSTEHARALLGRINFRRDAYAEAIRWWTALDAGKRTEWKCDEPLRQTVLLAGLEAFNKGRYEEAAERFREAGKLGLRDRRLGPLIGLSLFKAGKRQLYQGEA
jgi:tetratricopeptide (TPR) repeat protein